MKICASGSSAFTAELTSEAAEGRNLGGGANDGTNTCASGSSALKAEVLSGSPGVNGRMDGSCTEFSRGSISENSFDALYASVASSLIFKTSASLTCCAVERVPPILSPSLHYI